MGAVLCLHVVTIHATHIKPRVFKMKTSARATADVRYFCASTALSAACMPQQTAKKSHTAAALRPTAAAKFYDRQPAMWVLQHGCARAPLVACAREASRRWIWSSRASLCCRSAFSSWPTPAVAAWPKRHSGVEKGVSTSPAGSYGSTERGATGVHIGHLAWTTSSLALGLLRPWRHRQTASTLAACPVAALSSSRR